MSAGPAPAHRKPDRRIGARELAAALGLPPPTDEQCEVVESPPGPLVVIAGAGSGKTETMAARVVWLVANGHVAADAVLGLTFTRKAAAELGARIRRRLRAWALHSGSSVLGPDRPPTSAGSVAAADSVAGEPTVLTYAAYAGRLVADHGLRLGLEPSTRLISPAVAWQLADTAVRRYDGDLPDLGVPASVTGWVLALAGQFADHLAGPDDVQALTDRILAELEALPRAPRARNPYPGRVADFVKALEHRRELLPLVRAFAEGKVHRQAADFADQMVYAARLAALPDVQATERERFAAVLLDEYQDTGHAQVALLGGLFGGGHNVTAVGDPFQSIYGWRGASAGNILRFAGTFPTVEGVDVSTPAPTRTLSTSWRNDTAILEVANLIAAPLRARSRGTVQLSARPDAGPADVRASYHDTAPQEAEWIAAALAEAWPTMPRPRTAAVLVRRRTQIPTLERALRAAGLPVEIVGLGGLLLTPEVADVVATLQVLADHTSGPALLRLLSGARWRIGPRDLVALSRRARDLVSSHRGAPPRGVDVSPDDTASVIEALDDLGAPERYSPAGHERLMALAAELRYLRRRLSLPLPELVAEVERTIGVDVEVAARPDRGVVGRVHLDRFLDEAAGFAAEADQATLSAFLAFLTAAEEEENALEAGEVVVDSERVQLLTVHGAKGLEWDAVAIPGLVETIFPSVPRTTDWTRTRQVLPFPLRGDRDDLPDLRLTGVEHRGEITGRLEDFEAEVKLRHRDEERRLAYVAVTRARHLLLLSGAAWDTTLTPRDPSQFLLDARQAPGLRVETWAEPDPDAGNPLLSEAVSAEWPYDPLGRRRDAVADGADLVRAAMSAPPGGDLAPDGSDVLVGLLDDETERIAQWRRDVDLLLAERRLADGPQRLDIEVPARLSVSQLVALRRDPADFARRIRRPLPARPVPQARRGTAFHLWLEQRWSGERLLDLDELPGAQDAGAAPDGQFALLRAAFEASLWAARTPHEVEVPFETVMAGSVVRGRMDAVFAGRVDDPTGPGWTVVDWKTGAVPTGAAAEAAAIQLAAYRVAWARLAGVAVDEVHAAFHYVAHDVTFAPVDLLGEPELVALVASAGKKAWPG